MPDPVGPLPVDRRGKVFGLRAGVEDRYEGVSGPEPLFLLVFELPDARPGPEPAAPGGHPRVRRAADDASLQHQKDVHDEAVRVRASDRDAGSAALVCGAEREVRRISEERSGREELHEQARAVLDGRSRYRVHRGTDRADLETGPAVAGRVLQRAYDGTAEQADHDRVLHEVELLQQLHVGRQNRDHIADRAQVHPVRADARVRGERAGVLHNQDPRTVFPLQPNPQNGRHDFSRRAAAVSARLALESPHGARRKQNRHSDRSGRVPDADQVRVQRARELGGGQAIRGNPVQQRGNQQEGHGVPGGKGAAADPEDGEGRLGELQPDDGPVQREGGRIRAGEADDSEGNRNREETRREQGDHRGPDEGGCEMIL